MDNLDALMSKVSIKKEKSKKEDTFANNSRTNSLLTNNSTLASSPKSYDENEYGIFSPKAPVFKYYLQVLCIKTNLKLDHSKHLMT